MSTCSRPRTPNPSDYIEEWSGHYDADNAVRQWAEDVYKRGVDLADTVVCVATGIEPEQTYRVRLEAPPRFDISWGLYPSTRPEQ